MAKLRSLAPLQLNHVMDLVEAAGIDVSDWSNYAKGDTAPKANPRYCYEWAFVEPRRVVVLCLWHEELVEKKGRIIQAGNVRVDATALKNGGPKAALWARRAMRFDSALQVAVKDSLPVRVVLNAGVRRKRADPNAQASQVSLRALDDKPWAVASYDFETGDYVLERGKLPLFVDQFDTVPLAMRMPTRRDRTVSVFGRSEQVRRFVLARAVGRCEHCGAVGFSMSNGQIYLETHHIVSMSDGGADHTSNVIALCPNHHREAHHGERALDLRTAFKKRIKVR